MLHGIAGGSIEFQNEQAPKQAPDSGRLCQMQAHKRRQCCQLLPLFDRPIYHKCKVLTLQ
jgi:hypothetical protein